MVAVYYAPLRFWFTHVCGYTGCGYGSVHFCRSHHTFTTHTAVYYWFTTIWLVTTRSAFVRWFTTPDPRTVLWFALRLRLRFSALRLPFTCRFVHYVWLLPLGCCLRSHMVAVPLPVARFGWLRSVLRFAPTTPPVLPAAGSSRLRSPHWTLRLLYHWVHHCCSCTLIWLPHGCTVVTFSRTFASHCYGSAVLPVLYAVTTLRFTHYRLLPLRFCGYFAHVLLLPVRFTAGLVAVAHGSRLVHAVLFLPFAVLDFTAHLPGSLPPPVTFYAHTVYAVYRYRFRFYRSRARGLLRCLVYRAVHRLRRFRTARFTTRSHHVAVLHSSLYVRCAAVGCPALNYGYYHWLRLRWFALLRFVYALRVYWLRLCRCYAVHGLPHGYILPATLRSGCTVAFYTRSTVLVTVPVALVGLGLHLPFAFPLRFTQDSRLPRLRLPFALAFQFGFVALCRVLPPRVLRAFAFTFTFTFVRFTHYAFALPPHTVACTTVGFPVRSPVRLLRSGLPRSSWFGYRLLDSVRLFGYGLLHAPRFTFTLVYGSCRSGYTPVRLVLHFGYGSGLVTGYVTLLVGYIRLTFGFYVR